MLPESPGNPYQHLLANKLKDLGLDVRFLPKLPREPWFFRNRNRKSILHIHWISPLYNWHWKTPIRFIRFMIKLLIARLLGYKIVWTVHNIVPHEKTFPFVDFFGRIFMTLLANDIIFHCNYAKNEFLKRFRRTRGLHIVPHGNFLNCYHEFISKYDAKKNLKIPTDSFVYLFFGNVRSYKGIDQLIDSFQKSNEHNALLLIAGRCGKKEKSALYKASKDDNRIRVFDGFVPQNKVHIYFSAADVLVAPFTRVLTSGSVILALSYGIPIISTASGCIPEIMNQKAGVLFDPSNDKELFRALESIKDMDLKKMGHEAYEIAKSLDWKLIAEKTYQIYYSSCEEYTDKYHLN
jgi:glycosyltransferase involved in cell wall biosynthesis